MCHVYFRFVRLRLHLTDLNGLRMFALVALPGIDGAVGLRHGAACRSRQCPFSHLVLRQQWWGTPLQHPTLRWDWRDHTLSPARSGVVICPMPTPRLCLRTADWGY
ncbi:hypothetical protein BDA96_01G134400 [Sorghum bicolor]|uniref:Uncharacterized protein n=2 Tax=Sorghum bicolor TaxID=4558 RepID=A0A921UYG7_SORBI|nr:hypothetical protein SORBI_3001G129100 [Sorghum bicolor]KAG0548065.1 hypothetical protein BDA96_01G134400 [Sorghum bicolor]